MIGSISIKNPNTGSFPVLAGEERHKQLGSDVMAQFTAVKSAQLLFYKRERDRQKKKKRD